MLALLSYVIGHFGVIFQTFSGCVRLTQLSEGSVYDLNASPAGCTLLNKKKPGLACQPHRVTQTLGLNPSSLGLSVSAWVLSVKHRSPVCSPPFTPKQLDRAHG